MEGAAQIIRKGAEPISNTQTTPEISDLQWGEHADGERGEERLAVIPESEVSTGTGRPEMEQPAKMNDDEPSVQTPRPKYELGYYYYQPTGQERRLLILEQRRLGHNGWEYLVTLAHRRYVSAGWLPESELVSLVRVVGSGGPRPVWHSQEPELDNRRWPEQDTSRWK
jgi:hypothetical protein